MASKNYTCFVISPIGNKLGNDQQKKIYEDFMNVLNYLILPALRAAGFEEGNIIRSDREDGSHVITESIQNHLKNDDLCIADLTGNNVNVMYEYGVRVGIGKPVIAITSDSATALPFDVANIRTLQYDINSVSGLIDAQRKLENMVRKQIEQGFQPKSGSGSYTELSERLSAIEKMLAKFIANKGDGPVPVVGNATEIIRELGGEIPAFNYVLSTRDVTLGEELMPRLKKRLPYNQFLDKVVGPMASLGSEKAGEEIKNHWAYIKDNLTLRQQFELLASYITYSNRFDKEVVELPFISDEIERLENEINQSDMQMEEKNEQLAALFNQLNRLYHGAYMTANRGSEMHNHKDWLKKAADSLEKAIDLNSKQPSFYYNLAMIQDELGYSKQAMDSIRKCLELNTEDADHLSLAYRLLVENGEGEEAKGVKETLRRINPYAAAML